MNLQCKSQFKQKNKNYNLKFISNVNKKREKATKHYKFNGIYYVIKFLLKQTKKFNDFKSWLK